jgi:hypothetical protein
MHFFKLLVPTVLAVTATAWSDHLYTREADAYAAAYADASPDAHEDFYSPLQRRGNLFRVSAACRTIRSNGKGAMAVR